MRASNSTKTSPHVQARFGHRQRCFNHTNRVRRPKHGRSASSTSTRYRDPTRARHSQDTAAAALEVEIAIRRKPAASITDTRTTSTSGKPDKQLAHPRQVGLRPELLEFWMRPRGADSSSPPRHARQPPSYLTRALRSEEPVNKN